MTTKIEQLQESLEYIQSNVSSSFDAKNLLPIVNDYAVFEIQEGVYAILIELLIRFFDHYIFVAKDCSKISIPREIEQTDDLRYEDAYDTNLERLNVVEAYVMYQILQITNYMDCDAQFGFIIEQIHVNFPTLPQILTIEQFLQFPLHQTVVLFNKWRLQRGPNNDSRSTRNRDYIMKNTHLDETKFLIFKNIKQKINCLNEDCKVVLTGEYKIVDILFAYINLKSSKFDRWYELYCLTARTNSNPPQLIIDFDYGS